MGPFGGFWGPLETRVTIAQRKGGHTHVHTGWGHGVPPKNLVSVATFHPTPCRSDIHTKGRDLWPPGCQSQGGPGCSVPIMDAPDSLSSSQALLRWGRGRKMPLDPPRSARPPCRCWGAWGVSATPAGHCPLAHGDPSGHSKVHTGAPGSRFLQKLPVCVANPTLSLCFNITWNS